MLWTMFVGASILGGFSLLAYLVGLFIEPQEPLAAGFLVLFVCVLLGGTAYILGLAFTR